LTGIAEPTREELREALTFATQRWIAKCNVVLELPSRENGWKGYRIVSTPVDGAPLLPRAEVFVEARTKATILSREFDEAGVVVHERKAVSVKPLAADEYRLPGLPPDWHTSNRMRATARC
jgi:hypothetical protein